MSAPWLVGHDYKLTAGCLLVTPILIFAKPPRAGTSKTRLAADVGHRHAAAMAQAMLRDTWALCESIPRLHPVLVTTAPGEPHGVEGETWEQCDGDLGARLAHAFGGALRRWPSAIALGADAPHMPAKRLLEARQALESQDAVLCPADDGGFALLGLRRCPDGLFEQVAWSSQTTCREMVTNLQAHLGSLKTLAPQFDIDDLRDVRRLVNECAPASCPLSYAVARKIVAETQSNVPAGSST